MLDPTAVHEAGHAVMAHALGFKVSALSIVRQRVPGGTEMGHIVFDCPSLDDAERDRALAERQILVGFAGPVAEVNLFKLARWADWQTPLWSDRGDFGRVAWLVQTHSRGDFNAYFYGLIRRTRALLAIRTREIANVAAALMQERELDAEGFLEVL